MRVVVLLVAAAAVFGAADQYLGSLSAHPWGADISLLSAPWLVLAFVAGWTQRDPKRAALLGLACTVSALVGYGLMTLSPVENAVLTTQSVAGFVRSQSVVIFGGLLTGPLFGWLGFRWRTERAWPGALLLAGAVLLEPVAHAYTREPIRFWFVWIPEVLLGIGMAAYFARQTVTAQRQT